MGNTESTLERKVTEDEKRDECFVHDILLPIFLKDGGTSKGHCSRRKTLKDDICPCKNAPRELYDGFVPSMFRIGANIRVKKLRQKLRREDHEDNCAYKKAQDAETHNNRLYFDSALIVENQEKNDRLSEMNQHLHQKNEEYEIHSYDNFNKGFLLIINYMFSGTSHERKGSEEDVANLKDFFEKKLYDVDLQNDLSTAELEKYLQHLRDNTLSENSSNYHSFICVVMSHGNESGISTTDGLIGLDKIVDFFKNDTFRAFVGKPKVFIFQACRGDKSQQKYEIDGCRRNIKCDSSGLSTRLPKDADMLKIYATTLGHVSYRISESKSWNGSFLIRTFLDAAQKFPRRHLADIMTAVRYELSTNPDYEDEGKCHIAVSENTLTKHFYL